MEHIKAIFFDLDDTLLDTWRQLVGPAAREACQAMIAAGLAAQLEEAIQQREHFHKANPKADVYHQLAQHFGHVQQGDLQSVRDAGHNAYFNREVTGPIHLFEGVAELLQALGKSRQQFLVTSGHPRTQERKVELLGVAPYFQAITYVNRDQGHSKAAAFAALLEHHNLDPATCLCVGDRPDREIRAANELGMTTVRVRYGEFSHLDAVEDIEVADHRIESVRELWDLFGL